MSEWGKGDTGHLNWVPFLKGLGQTVALELWKRLWDPEFTVLWFLSYQDKEELFLILLIQLSPGFRIPSNFLLSKFLLDLEILLKKFSRGRWGHQQHLCNLIVLWYWDTWLELLTSFVLARPWGQCFWVASGMRGQCLWQVPGTDAFWAMILWADDKPLTELQLLCEQNGCTFNWVLGHGWLERGALVWDCESQKGWSGFLVMQLVKMEQCCCRGVAEGRSNSAFLWWLCTANISISVLSRRNAGYQKEAGLSKGVFF